MVVFLMMFAKFATSELLKIKVFWNKDDDVMIFVNDVTNKVLLRESNYIVDVVMLTKFGNSNVSMKEAIITPSSPVTFLQMQSRLTL